MDFVRSIIGLGAIGSGLWAVALGVRAVLAARAASAWPTVRGRMVSAGSEKRNVGTFAGRGVYHQAIVVYEYEVGGRPFTGSRIHAGGDVWIGGISSQEVLSRYPAGSDIDVYVDPGDPANACLDPGGAAWLVNLAAGAGAILFGAGILLGWWLRR